jgi:hypothetical protein
MRVDATRVIHRASETASKFFNMQGFEVGYFILDLPSAHVPN